MRRTLLQAAAPLLSGGRQRGGGGGGGRGGGGGGGAQEARLRGLLQSMGISKGADLGEGAVSAASSVCAF